MPDVQTDQVKRASGAAVRGQPAEALTAPMTVAG